MGGGISVWGECASGCLLFTCDEGKLKEHVWFLSIKELLETGAWLIEDNCVHEQISYCTILEYCLPVKMEVEGVLSAPLGFPIVWQDLTCPSKDAEFISCAKSQGVQNPLSFTSVHLEVLSPTFLKETFFCKTKSSYSISNPLLPFCTAIFLTAHLSLPYKDISV